MRVWWKYIVVAVLIPVVLFLLAASLLYIPAVQNTVAGKVVAAVGESTGWTVGFDRLRLSFPLDLTVHRAVIKTGSDTLVCLDRLTADVRLKPLLKGQVVIKGLLMESLRLHTGNLIEGMVIGGTAGKAYLRADSVNVKDEQAWIDRLILSDADVYMFLCDTAVADTAAEPVSWRIELNKVELNRVAFDCRMPCDSIFVNLQLDRAVLSDGIADLGLELYCVAGLQAQIDELFYGTDLNDTLPAGLDLSHIRLSDVFLSSDSLQYSGDTGFSTVIRECSAKERTGLVVKSFTGRIEVGDLQLGITDLMLQTPFSTLRMQAAIPWSSIDEKSPEGRFSLNAAADVHKQDIIILSGEQAEDFQAWIPDTVLTFEASASGNLNDLTLHTLAGKLSGAFNFRLTGSAVSLTDDRLRAGRSEFAVETQNIDFLAGLLPPAWQQRFQIPDSMRLAGHLTFENELYATEAVWQESDAKISFSGSYHTSTERYDAFLKIDSLEPVHFMPDDSILRLDAFVRAKGRGTDFYHHDTQLTVEGRINELRYGDLSLTDNISFSANLDCHQLQAALESTFPLLKGTVSLDGDVQQERITGMIIADIDSLDLYELKLTGSPLSTSFQFFSEFETDLEQTHSLDVTVGNWHVALENQTVEPRMLTLSFRSDADTARASCYAGDMYIILTGNSGAESLMEQLSLLSEKAGEQLYRDSALHIEALRPYFPELSMQIKGGRDNPVYNFLQEYNTFFDGFHLEAAISPDEGLAVNGAVLALVKDTLKIDTVRLNISQDTLGLLYTAGVIKNRFRNQEPFKIEATGFVRNNEADVLASYLNSSGEKGLYLGVNAKKSPYGFDFRFYPAQSVIAFLPFTINEDNYFRFKNMNEMDADLRLEGNAQSSIKIRSTRQEDTMKDMMIEVSQINLQELSSGFAGLPALAGLLNITLRYEPEENSFMVIADGIIDDFYYENGRIGELLLNASYMPTGKEAHQIDLHAFHDMSEIASLSVLLTEGKDESRIDGFISVDQLPLDIVNAMIPDRTVQLDGRLNGKFDIGGTDVRPVMSGSLKIERGTASIPSLATTLHIDDQPVQMKNNRINLNKFKIYTQKENPLTVDGVIDAANMDNPVVNLTLTASGMQLLDTRKTPESMAYGRLFVNVNSTLSGSLSALRMRGTVHVPGNTNMTYVMSDSELEVHDNFNNLVTFTYLADTLPRRTGRPPGLARSAAATGTDVLMNINIDPVVRFRIALDDAQANYIDLRGGGNLSMQYTTQGDIRMNGRYTLSDGTIHYVIPVIPLTEFAIRNGSYVDWSGDPFNPYLNITAYTRVRSSVNFGGESRMVNFNTGIQLRDYLDDVTVQFLLEAPTDAVIQNHLMSMGAEARSMQAISLLMTGVYLASEGATGNYNMNVSAALNTLLQREIKNILGNLMGDVPVSFDVNTYDGTQGMGRRIDYIGRFYKDFFNDRINTSLGLRYSTQDPVFGNKFFPDDISFGYRLDTDGARSFQFFRSREYENTFEGEIAKFGAGFTLRRKIKSLNDLFTFKKRTSPIPTKEEDDDEEE